LTDNERVKIRREPNYWHFEGAGTGQEGVRCLPRVWHQSADILPVEEQVFPPGRKARLATQAWTGYPYRSFCFLLTILDSLVIQSETGMTLDVS